MVDADYYGSTDRLLLCYLQVADGTGWWVVGGCVWKCVGVCDIVMCVCIYLV